MDNSQLQKLPRNYIKAEMQRRDLKAQDMVELLSKNGTNIVLQSFHNKISRGNFSVQFFFECMRVMGVKKLEIE